MERKIRSRQLVAFRLANWGDPPREQKLAVLAELLPAPEAPELLALADPILNPPPFVDPAFGRFTPMNHAPDWYEQTALWMGQNVRVRLVKGDKQLEDCMVIMRKLWADQESWDLRARGAIADDIFANDHEWLEGTPAETRDGLLNSLGAMSLSIMYDGSFTIEYIEKDELELFGGHSFVVEASVDGGIHHVSMEG